MTDKELRKLRRDDLLQILISQQRQIDELNAALRRSEEELAKRSVAIEESGSLAEASLKLNGVFEAAQAAAEQYLSQMRERADALLAGAEKQAGEARQLADVVVRNARAEADRILSQASAAGGEAPPKPEDTPGEDDGDDNRRRGLLWRNRKS